MTTLTRDQVKAQVTAMVEGSDNTAISLWREFASEEGYEGDLIYDNDEYTINEMFDSPMSALRAANYGDYNYAHEYFHLNGYGNLETFDFASDEYSPIDVDRLTDWVFENQDNSEIADYLDFDEAEEDDSESQEDEE